MITHKLQWAGIIFIALLFSACGGGAPQNGLLGQYFNGVNFDKLIFERVDETINFDFADGAPTEGEAATDSDHFSIRWTGSLMVPETGRYTISMFHNDGVRVFISDMNTPKIEYWVDGKLTHSTIMVLEAGTPYEIKIELYEGINTCQAKLIWESEEAGIEQEIIPSKYLIAP